MQNLKSYFEQLSQRDKLLLVIAACLLGFAFFKVAILDSQNNKNEKLLKRSSYIQEQANTLPQLNSQSGFSTSSLNDSGQVVSDFLKRSKLTDRLKQIRTTSGGDKRFELENIQFSDSVELLNVLDKNGTIYSSVQIKQRKNPGLVNLVLTLSN